MNETLDRLETCEFDRLDCMEIDEETEGLLGKKVVVV